jgi:hypothetical protein
VRRLTLSPSPLSAVSIFVIQSVQVLQRGNRLLVLTYRIESERCEALFPPSIRFRCGNTSIPDCRADVQLPHTARKPWFLSFGQRLTNLSIGGLDREFPTHPVRGLLISLQCVELLLVFLGVGSCNLFKAR